MEENWDDDGGGSAATVNGKQDSWEPKGNAEGSSWAPNSSDNNDGGWKPRGGGGFSGGRRNGDDRSESGGGWKPRGGGGGRGGYNRRDEEDNDGSGGGWKPRGGGGGRGGYNNRRDEEDNDGSGGGWKPRGGRGGYNNRRDEEDNDGSGGGWKPRGGGGGRRDDGDSQESGGGFRPRGGGRGRYQDENSEGGGWQPRRNDRSDFSNGGGEGDGGESGYKPYGRGRGGGRGGRSFGDEDGDGGGGYRRGRGGRGGGRGGSFGDREGEDGGRGGGGGRGGDGGEGEDGEKRQPLYIPKERPDDEETLFKATHSGINFAKYEDIEVKVSGENIPPKINAFEESGLRQFLLDNVKKSKYLTPTPVQKYALPIIMAKRDLMACAQTGSGKTAAFMLPIVENLMAGGVEGTMLKETQEPYAVILAPTRELALQIFDEARKFTHGTIIKSQVAYGGVSVGYQLRQLESGCHILVATPGRMHDFIERGKLSFAKLKYFVLDEADRMLDTGFRPEVEKVARMCKESQDREELHTLMFSATFPKDVQELARNLLKQDYIFLAVGMIGGANTDVEQTLLQVQKFDKMEKLIEILGPDAERVLVFVATKRSVDFVAMRLSQKIAKATSIHGDRYQEQREEAIRTFKSGEMKVLVATSVAARGLDIPDVRHVVNYDLPLNIEEYVHRIGRTGRVGKSGKATSFYDSQFDSKIAGDLVKVLSDAQQVVPDWLESEIASGGYGSSAPSSRFGGSDVRGFRSRTEMTHVDSSEGWDSEQAAARSGGTEEVEESWD